MEYGLCFSGGGGKGAYEIGVWKALKQLEKDKDIVAVSGASIGAVNGLLFTVGNYDNAEKIWSKVTVGDFLISGEKSICSCKKLREILEEDIDYDYVKFSKVRFFANTSVSDEKLAFPEKAEDIKPFVKEYKSHFRTEYFELNKSGKDKIIETVVASSSLPAIYEPVRIDGRLMFDGGLTDNVPIRPLIEECDCKNLIIVMVGRDNEYDPYLASRLDNIIEIRPSADIGGFTDGTLDFTHKSIRYRMLLGYYDTLRVFDMNLRKKLGAPYSEEDKIQSLARDHKRILSELNSALAVDQALASKRKYEDLLGKYSKKYGIDL